MSSQHRFCLTPSKLSIALLSILLSSCDTNNETLEKSNLQKEEISHQSFSIEKRASHIHLDTIKQEAKILFSELESQCSSLYQSLDSFIEIKNESNIQAAYRNWKHCHNAYINTRFLRALTKELDIIHPELDTDLATDNNIKHSNHTRLDKFPMLQGYIDSVEGYPYSGLIHSEIELSYDSLAEEHQLGDEAYVAIGFHAIEFMLIGAQANASLRLKDYLKNEDKQHNKLAKRRSEYLSLLGQTLKEDIQQLIGAWEADTDFYPAQLQLVSSQRLQNVLQNLSEVEIEAVTKIRETQKASPSLIIHDTKFTLDSREKIASRIKQKIDPLTASKQQED